MRTIINALAGLFLLLLISHPLYPQSADQNYVMTRTQTNAAGTTFIDVIQYYDGLGRPTETVRHTGRDNDVTTLQEYDNFGRPSKTWVSSYNMNFDGRYTGTSTAATRYSDTYPYTETVYEASPLNRPVEVRNPGAAWRSANRSVKTEYLTNTGTSPLVCAYYYLSGNNLVRSNNYSPGQLYVTKMTDEDNHISYQFKDKQGKVILERSLSGGLNHDTYYTYDDNDNLTWVLPPLASDSTTANGTYTESTRVIDKYAYLYRYDERNRCMEKKLPGIGWTYYVYDKADRLRMIQDPEQRTRKEWTYNKYDQVGRSVATGTIIKDAVREAMKTAVNANVVLYETLSTASDGNYYLYTNSSYPTASTTDGTQMKELTTTYYDNYDFVVLSGTLNTPLAYTAGISDAEYTSAKGQVTGSRSALLDESGKYIYRHTRYDDHARPIQAKATNILGDMDYEYYKYGYTGQVIEKNIKTKNNTNSEKYTYTYDSSDRLGSSNYTLNSNPAKTTNYTYTDNGQVLNIMLNGITTVAYGYNLRGWVTKINSTLFTEELFYNTNPNYNGQVSYNGNISATRWKDYTLSQYQPTTIVQRGYTYVYDELNRMTNAGYGEGTLIQDNSNRYNENFNFDKHGNVNQIVRHGRFDNLTYGVIDIPSVITYDGNRWNTVTDYCTTSQNAADIMEFRKAWEAPYKYDALGRMTKDSTKNISKIEYNCLSLPRRMTMLSGDKIENIYDASGVKHQTLYYTKSSNPTTTTTAYAANKIMENGTLRMILNETGYSERSGTVDNFYYYLKDHLGSNRIVVNSAGQIHQRTNYYPYGMTLAENPARTDQSYQPYKFNGKQLDRFGVDLYDYDKRSYCSASGRFTTPDPLCEKYYAISPYAYCGNNPVNRIDPTGMDWVRDKEKNIIWNDDAISTKTTPEGCTYIGNDKALLDHLGMAYDFSELSSNQIGFVAFDENVGMHMINVKEKSNVRTEVNTGMNSDNATETNATGKTFNGVNVVVTNVSSNSGTDGELPGSSSIMKVEYGGKVYTTALTEPTGTNYSQAGTSVTQGVVSIPTSDINFSNSFSKVEVKGNWWVTKPEGRTPVVTHGLLPIPKRFTHTWTFPKQ